jgi:hypothetical protein
VDVHVGATVLVHEHSIALQTATKVKNALTSGDDVVKRAQASAPKLERLAQQL